MGIPKRIIHILLAGLCLISIIAAITLGIRYSLHQRRMLENIKTEAQQETGAAAHKIGQFVGLLAPTVNKLADELNRKERTLDELIPFISQKPDAISGIGICTKPYSLSSPEQRYALYCVERDGKQQIVQLHKQLDYTKPEHQWYHIPILKGAQFLDKKLWTLPEHVLIGFAAPFFKHDATKGRMPAGIVFAHQTAEHIKHILTTIYLGKTGYWFVLSKDNTLLVHPYDKHGDEQNKLTTIMKKHKKVNRHTLEQQIADCTSGVINYRNEIDGKPSWLFIEPIPSTSWRLCRVFSHDEIPLDSNARRKTIMLLSLALLAFLIFLILLIASIIEVTILRLWLASFSIATILMFELIALWYIIWNMPPYKEHLVPIRDKVSLYAFLDSIAHKHTTHNKKRLQKKTVKEIDAESTAVRHEPTLSEHIQRILHYRYKQSGYIPTGIYIQHLNFVTERQIEMTAYVWQRYFDGVHDGISRGFVLPQAAVTKITELYRTKDQETETIIWEVRATINQRILYVKYPFDVKDIQIQIAHKDFSQNVVLVPDLASYKLIHPTSLPGLSKEIYLPGWHIANSYFGYKITDYDTSFGLYSYGPLGIYKQIEKCNQPELSYNVTAQRFLVNTLVADLLPLAIIALLLFVILLTGELQGFAFLGTCASVFFGALIAQARFRGTIESYRLVYFETFYLVMYAALLIIVLTSLLYILKIRVPIIHYKKNLITKLLYWPAILVTLLIITFRYFY